MAAQLVCRASFGVKSDVRGGVAFSDDESLLVASGAYIVKHAVGKSNRSVHDVICGLVDAPVHGSLDPSVAIGIGTPRRQAVLSAMAVSSTLRYVAIAEAVSSPTSHLRGQAVQNHDPEPGLNEDGPDSEHAQSFSATNATLPSARVRGGDENSQQHDGRPGSGFQGKRPPEAGADPALLMQPAVVVYNARTMGRKRVVQLPPELQWPELFPRSATTRDADCDSDVTQLARWPDITNVAFSADDAILVAVFSRVVPELELSVAAVGSRDAREGLNQSSRTLVTPKNRSGSARLRRADSTRTSSKAASHHTENARCDRAAGSVRGMGDDKETVAGAGGRERQHLIAVFSLDTGRLISATLAGQQTMNNSAASTEMASRLTPVEFDVSQSAAHNVSALRGDCDSEANMSDAKQANTATDTPELISSAMKTDDAIEAAAMISVASRESDTAETEAEILEGSAPPPAAVEELQALTHAVEDSTETAHSSSSAIVVNAASESILTNVLTESISVISETKPDTAEPKSDEYLSVRTPTSSDVALELLSSYAAPRCMPLTSTVYGVAFAPVNISSPKTTESGHASRASTSNLKLPLLAVWGRGLLEYYVIDSSAGAKPTTLVDAGIVGGSKVEVGATMHAVTLGATLVDRQHRFGPLRPECDYTAFTWLRAQSAGNMQAEAASSESNAESAACVVGTAHGELLLQVVGGSRVEVINTTEIEVAHKTSESADSTLVEVCSVGALASTPQGFIAGVQGGTLLSYVVTRPSRDSATTSSEDQGPSLAEERKSSATQIASDARRNGWLGAQLQQRRVIHVPPTMLDNGDSITSIVASPHNICAAIVISGTQIGIVNIADAFAEIPQGGDETTTHGTAVVAVVPCINIASHGAPPTVVKSRISSAGLDACGSVSVKQPRSLVSVGRARSTRAASSCEESEVSLGAGFLPLASSAALLSADVATRRPIAVTLGVDSGVRVWNVIEKAHELMRTFPDGPQCVAIHPSGYELALGFPDKLRIATVLVDDIRLTRAINFKAATQVRFAHGGHAIAASGGSLVAIADLYGAPCIATAVGMTPAAVADGYLTLRGHSTTVTCVEWSTTDATVVSCGLDGAVYEWDVRTGKRCRYVMDSVFTSSTSVSTCIVHFQGARLRSLALMPTPSNTSSTPAPTVSGTRKVGGLSSSVSLRHLSDASAVDDTGIIFAVGEMTTSQHHSHGDAKLATQGAHSGHPIHVATSTTQYVLLEINMASGRLLRTVVLPGPPSSVVVVPPTPNGAATGGASTASQHAPMLGEMKTAVASAPTPRLLAVGLAGDGGRPGAILSFALPLTHDAACVRVGTVPGGVTSMRLSEDNSRIVAAGGDGSVAVYELRDANGRSLATMAEGGGRLPWAQEVLVAPAELEERKNAAMELRDKIGEAKTNEAYAARVRSTEAAAALAAISERYAEEIAREQALFAELAAEHDELHAAHDKEMTTFAMAHDVEVLKREALYQSRMMTEVDRYNALDADTNAMRDAWEKKRLATATQLDRGTAAIINECEEALSAIRKRRTDLEREVVGVDTDWEEAQRQMEEDLDTEIQDVSRSIGEKLTAEREAALRFKGENGVMKKKFGTLLRSIEDGKAAVKASLDIAEELKRGVTALEREIGVLRGAIRDKDIAIADRERRIYDLKKKNQELEKFKFVLDYKIRELKLQVEPREAEIRAMRRQIKEVDAELSAYHTANAELDAMIGDLRTTLAGQHETAATLRIALQKRTAIVTGFPPQLHSLIDALDDYSRLKEGITKLYNAYASVLSRPKVGPPVVGDGSQSQTERRRQRIGATAGATAPSGVTTSRTTVSTLQRKASSTSVLRSGRAAPPPQSERTLRGGAPPNDLGENSAVINDDEGDAGGSAASHLASGTSEILAGTSPSGDSHLDTDGVRALMESQRQLAHLQEVKAALQVRCTAAEAAHARRKADLIAANQAVLRALSAVRERVGKIRVVQRTFELDVVTSGGVVDFKKLRALGILVVNEAEELEQVGVSEPLASNSNTGDDDGVEAEAERLQHAPLPRRGAPTRTRSSLAATDRPSGHGETSSDYDFVDSLTAVPVGPRRAASTTQRQAPDFKFESESAVTTAAIAAPFIGARSTYARRVDTRAASQRIVRGSVAKPRRGMNLSTAGSLSRGLNAVAKLNSAFTQQPLADEAIAEPMPRASTMSGIGSSDGEGSSTTKVARALGAQSSPTSTRRSTRVARR